jgi:polyhydroxyalkanoate synthase subunit PhaC
VSATAHTGRSTREALSAEVTGGLSPGTLALALFDWSLHVAIAPGKRMELVDKAARKLGRVLAYMAAASTDPDTPLCIEPLPGDYRFRAEGWQKQPYSFWAQGFLLSLD